jgi:TRAP-type mannitol/chloroaromatic compound transport system permease large subunit
VTCTIFAACTGVIAATVTTMTMVAIPSMLKRKYDKGWQLGLLRRRQFGDSHPPSVMLVMYGPLQTCR